MEGDVMPSPVVTSTLFLLKTRLGRVMVYRAMPVRARKGWHKRNRIHVWSRWDLRVLKFPTGALTVNVPRACPLTTAVASRWWFVRQGNEDDDVDLFVDGWLPWPRYVETFCEEMPQLSGTAALLPGVPLYLHLQ